MQSAIGLLSNKNNKIFYNGQEPKWLDVGRGNQQKIKQIFGILYQGLNLQLSSSHEID